MFEKDVNSSGPENPAYFRQGGRRIGNRAKRQGRHDAVEPADGERQVLAGPLDALNRKARCRNPLGNLRRQHLLGVERHQARYASRVVRQVEAGAEADFEHFSVHGRLSEISCS